MKPIKLKMQAFGPYVKPVELDFENGLNGEKFFLIHGATGAGKTSILDAICYALYDKSSSGEKETNNLRSELAALDINTEVEFTFALGEKIYKIRRNPGHKMPKGKGDVKKIAELYVDGEFKTSDAKEIDELIKSRIGFNADQFRQVVMLPQNQFTKFLKAKNDEKAEILNVIFNSDLYAKIEDGLKEKADDAKKLKKELEDKRENFLNEVQGIGKVSEPVDEKFLAELIKNFNEEFKRAVDARNNLKIASDKASVALTDGKVLNSQFLTFENAAKNFQSESKILIEVEKNFQLAKIEYDKREGEKSQRDKLDDKIKELKKIQESVEELNNKKSELAKAESAEKSAQEKISQLEHMQKKCESRLTELKNKIAALEGADVKFKVAEQNLEKSKDKQTSLIELERLKKELSATQKRLATAEKNYNDAQTELDRLKLLQKMCTAAKLAANLADGEPCPVCGSTSHPNLAVTDKIIPTDEEIEQSERVLKRRDTEKISAFRAVNSINTKLDLQTEAIKKLAEVLELGEAQKIFDSAKNDADTLDNEKQNLKNEEKHTEKNLIDLDKARKNFSTASNSAATLRGIVKTLESQISAEYLVAPQKIFDDLGENQRAQKILEDAWKKAQENFHELDRKKSTQEGKVKSAENTKNDAAKNIEGKVKPDIVTLEKVSQDKSNLHAKAISEVTAMEKDFKRLHELFEKLDELGEKIQTADKNFQLWGRLSEVANGTSATSKISFRRYYLNLMFQNVIRDANERLYKMSSGRYQFQNMEGAKKHAKKAGLDLEILDIYTGKARPVETLSGGESFLASLSLALGLAAVVKNTAGGINLDTIFIDEGFGSLDSETLDFAINALTDLQKDGGRLVGIISHVEELKQRIPARLEVTKTKVGSTAKFI